MSETNVSYMLSMTCILSPLLVTALFPFIIESNNLIFTKLKDRFRLQGVKKSAGLNLAQIRFGVAAGQWSYIEKPETNRTTEPVYIRQIRNQMLFILVGCALIAVAAAPVHCYWLGG